METKDVANLYGVARSTVIQWCQKNNIKRKLGKNGVMEYVLTDRDLKKFEKRPGRGWKKGRSRKTDK